MPGAVCSWYRDGNLSTTVSCNSKVLVKLASSCPSGFHTNMYNIVAGQEKPRMCIWPLDMNTEQNI